MKSNIVVRVLTFCAIGLLIISCHKTLKDKLIGKWDYQNVTLNGQAISGAQMSNPTMEFKSNGQVTTIVGNIKTDEQWAVKGDSIVFTGEAKPHYLKIILFTPEHLVLQSNNTVVTTITLAPSKGDNGLKRGAEKD